MRNLITDRTEADLGTARGCYNASDLNRVEGAVSDLITEIDSLPDTLRALANTLGISWYSSYNPELTPPALIIKTDWTRWDFPTSSSMERYLGNVAALAEALGLHPSFPDTMENLTLTGANQIEQALTACEAALTEYEMPLYRAEAALPRSGAGIFAGML